MMSETNCDLFTASKVKAKQTFDTSYQRRWKAWGICSVENPYEMQNSHLALAFNYSKW